MCYVGLATAGEGGGWLVAVGIVGAHRGANTSRVLPGVVACKWGCWQVVGAVGIVGAHRRAHTSGVVVGCRSVWHGITVAARSVWHGITVAARSVWHGTSGAAVLGDQSVVTVWVVGAQRRVQPRWVLGGL
jgi:hypothetical protein